MRNSLTTAALAAFALSLGPAGSLGLRPAAAQEMGATTHEEIRDQGILYQRKKRHKQAKAALDKAYAMPEGPTDFKTVFYRGEAAYKLLLLEDAFEMTAAAAKLAEGERQKAEVLELQTELDSLFGKVTFKAAPGETNSQGRIFFESKTGIINRKKKALFGEIRERFRTTDIALPTSAYLPYGEYTANKVPFSIVQGEPAPELEIYLQVQTGVAAGGGGGGDGGGSGWMWVGLGAGTVAVAAIGVAAVVLATPEAEKPDQTRINPRPLD